MKLKETSDVFQDLKVGMRVKRNFTGWRGEALAGKIIGFKDVVDIDAMDNGMSEDESTVKGGAFVVLLDDAVRPRLKNEDGTVSVIDTWDVDYDAADDWVTV